MRAFIYQHFVETARPPTTEETASHFGVSLEEAGSIYRELHERHAIFLEPGRLRTPDKTKEAGPRFPSPPTPSPTGRGEAKRGEGEKAPILLEPPKVRMANPFSAAPTDFKVDAQGRTYFANCAWDMLGIPAALHSDAVIHAVCAESREPIQMEISSGEVWADDVKIHFLLPFARWYDDIVFT